MRCEEVKKSTLDGAPIEGELRAHIRACNACREEFGIFDSMRAYRPAPPPEARQKALASFSRSRRPVRWQVAGIAAAIAFALGLGFVVGRSVERPVRIEVKHVRVEVPVEKIVKVNRPLNDDVVMVVAVALMHEYRNYFRLTFKDGKCTKIVADRRILAKALGCPILRQVVRLQKERPGFVEVQ